MTKIVRWQPMREIVNLQNEIDRLFGRSLSQMNWPEGNEWGLSLDVLEKENDFVVTATVPGVNPDDIDITVVDNVLTIKGEIKAEKEEENQQYHLRERRYGSFARSISLQAPINTEAINATYENGILTLNLPKEAATQPKRIQVKTHRMVDG